MTATIHPLHPRKADVVPAFPDPDPCTAQWAAYLLASDLAPAQIGTADAPLAAAMASLASEGFTPEFAATMPRRSVAGVIAALRAGKLSPPLP
jgi:hypothetical protein